MTPVHAVALDQGVCAAGETATTGVGAASPLTGSPPAGRDFITPAKLEAFVAVVEEGSISAAARRLHVSQPAVSQTINALERRIGVELFLRSASGVVRTEAGQALLDEARAILSRLDQLMPAIVGNRGGDADTALRVGIPPDPAPNIYAAIAGFSEAHPDIPVQPRYLTADEQVAGLRTGDLDVSFMLEVPAGRDLDTLRVDREELGVLLPKWRAHRLSADHGVRLHALAGLQWLAFPRADSPAWYEEIVAVLKVRGVGVSAANDDLENRRAPALMAALLTSENAFALTPAPCAHCLPASITWLPLRGDCVARNTWAVWPAVSRRRDVAHLIGAFEAA
ncbi:LysR family transcriptional regulator [Mycobacterium sp. 3519A]|uniref:LysR family transcriptional regulator n=1 Tax=Mycobacterium sp. 3519A TaxID=2057184 RepID=UPI000C7C6766|nr:LysR family transcriptional regulator [Mycobacterium sp. 3519A]